MGRRGHRFFLSGRGLVRYRSVIEEKSPDFRSPEVGISALARPVTNIMHALRVCLMSRNIGNYVGKMTRTWA